MRILNKSFLIILLLKSNLIYAQKAKKAEPFIKTGTCELKYDPIKIEHKKYNTVCLVGFINQDSILTTKKNMAFATRLEAQLSQHYNRYHNFFLSGFIDRLSSNKPSQIPVITEKNIKEISYTAGNISLFPLSMTIGIQAPVFGVNKTPLTSLNKLFDPREFWDTSTPGLILRYDNLKNTIFEISHNIEKKREEGISTARFMYDYIYIPGLRSVISYQRETNSSHKAGVSVLMLNNNGSLFHFEVIYKKDLTENPQPTKQLIRFGVEENNKKNVSLFLLYDRVNNHSEQIHLGTMLNFPHKIRLKTVVSYQKKQIASKSDKEFFLSLGIGMHL